MHLYKKISQYLERSPNGRAPHWNCGGLIAHAGSSPALSATKRSKIMEYRKCESCSAVYGYFYFDSSPPEICFCGSRLTDVCIDDRCSGCLEYDFSGFEYPTCSG